MDRRFPFSVILHGAGSLAWVLYFEKGTALLDMMALPGFFGALAVVWLVSLFTQPPEKAAQEHEYVKEKVRGYRID